VMAYVAPAVEAGAVPVAVAPEHPRLLEPTDSVPPEPVAVNDVLPELSHDTAPAVDDSTANEDANAATSTTKRAILLMMFSYSYSE
jgi:hypothetical protein